MFTQFLHVRVPRAFQGIHRGTAQVRPELRQQFGVSQQFVLPRLVQSHELGVEVVVQENRPSHELIMVCDPYVVKDILRCGATQTPSRQ